MPPVATRDDLITLLRRVDAPDSLLADAVETYAMTLDWADRMDVIERYHDPDLKPIVRGIIYIVVQAVVAAQVVSDTESEVWDTFFEDTVREVGRVLVEDDAVLRAMAAAFLHKLKADAMSDLASDTSKSFIQRLEAVEHELS